MSEYNERQYRLMLNQLTQFENGRIALDTLVVDLEGLLNALQSIPISWKQTFLHEWGKLEDDQAYVLFKGIQTVDAAAIERIRAAISHLKLLVLEQIDDPSDLRRSKQ